MCGRLTMTHPNDALARLFQAAPANDLPEVPRFNVCPTQDLAVVVAGEGTGRRALRPMRWGFVPHWYKAPSDGPLLINARAETVVEKPAFRAAVRARRCLIAASGFYEWTKGEDGARLPWYFSAEDAAPLVFAGIWQDWAPPVPANDGTATTASEAEGPPSRLTTVAILTTGASDWMSRTHHREPVLLAQGDWPTWLGETNDKAAPLLRPAPEGTYRRWRVDRAVNSNRAQGPGLIEPLAG